MELKTIDTSWSRWTWDSMKRSSSFKMKFSCSDKTLTSRCPKSPSTKESLISKFMRIWMWRISFIEPTSFIKNLLGKLHNSVTGTNLCQMIKSMIDWTNTSIGLHLDTLCLSCSSETRKELTHLEPRGASWNCSKITSRSVLEQVSTQAISQSMNSSTTICQSKWSRFSLNWWMNLIRTSLLEEEATSSLMTMTQLAHLLANHQEESQDRSRQMCSWWGETLRASLQKSWELTQEADSEEEMKALDSAL